MHYAIHQHIILIGMPGAGKSTLGLRLAKQLGLLFTDTDQEVEKRAGMPIHQIWAEQGEAAFRAMEAEAMTEALEEAPSVIATGGGLPMQPGMMDKLLAGGLAVWLQVEAAEATRRLALQVQPRPLLSTPAAWAELLATRQAIYARAHVHVRDAEALLRVVS